MNEIRCQWALVNEEEQRYHDEEWGVPIHDDQKLFELLILEGMQAGLSWDCILKKRENFREAYDGFDIETIAAYSEEKQEELLENKGIVRNRRKIASSIQNAKAFLQVQQEFGSFDTYLWGFVNGKPIQNQWEEHEQIPAFTEQSDLISKDLKKRGFSFVGSTIVYAYMQSAGLVNDHVITCFRHKQCAKSGDLKERF